MVISDPFGIPGTYGSRVSSSASLPSSTSCRITVAVKVLLTLAMRKWSSVAIGAAVRRSAIPCAETQEPRPGMATPATAPGTICPPTREATIWSRASCSSGGKGGRVAVALASGVLLCACAWGAAAARNAAATPAPPASTARRDVVPALPT